MTHAHSQIRTLDPAKLTEEDYIDFSSRVGPGVRITPPPPSSSSSSSTDSSTAGTRKLTVFSACSSDWGARVYPPGTRGFMYHHVPPNTASSPLAGERLRFRVTPSRDPASFATGTNLLNENGQPWRYPLYKIVVWHGDSYRAITALLLHDGLVSQRTLDLAAASILSLRPKKTLLDINRNANLVAALPMLSAFGQEFTYHFSGFGSSCQCLFVGPEDIHKQHLRRIAQFQVCVDGNPVKYCPFQGSVVIGPPLLRRCFHSDGESFIRHSSLVLRTIESSPAHRKARRRPPCQAVHRCKACLSSRRTDITGGELLTVSHYGKVHPWTTDVDKEGKIKRALRVLFENESCTDAHGNHMNDRGPDIVSFCRRNRGNRMLLRLYHGQSYLWSARCRTRRSASPAHDITKSNYARIA